MCIKREKVKIYHLSIQDIAPQVGALLVKDKIQKNFHILTESSN